MRAVNGRTGASRIRREWTLLARLDAKGDAAQEGLPLQVDVTYRQSSAEGTKSTKGASLGEELSDPQ